MDSDFDKLAKELQKEIDEDAKRTYTDEVIQLASYPKNLGKKNNPDGSASIQGLCGDSMQVFLSISGEIITDASFTTDGCGVTLACGSVTTELAKNRHVNELLMISPADIISVLKKLPRENLHCAILAVNTLHKALADYLLRKQMD